MSILAWHMHGPLLMLPHRLLLIFPFSSRHISIDRRLKQSRNTRPSLGRELQGQTPLSLASSDKTANRCMLRCRCRIKVSCSKIAKDGRERKGKMISDEGDGDGDM